jgi:hypothetical protein
MNTKSKIIEDHINNRLDTGVFKEDTHNILQGNIGMIIAGEPNRLNTKLESNSILGDLGDTIIETDILEAVPIRLGDNKGIKYTNYVDEHIQTVDSLPYMINPVIQPDTNHTYFPGLGFDKATGPYTYKKDEDDVRHNFRKLK